MTSPTSLWIISINLSNNFYKLVNDKDPESLFSFINWLEKFSENEHISFVLSITSDPENVPEQLKKYLI